MVNSFNQNLVYISKPLLISTLAVWFSLETRLKSLFSKLILGALIFSVGGDTLLMFVQSYGEQFFLLGLTSFLMAHVCYFLAFYNYKKDAPGLIKRKPWTILPLTVYFIGFIWFLLPDVPESMKIPVFIYSMVIASMALSAQDLQGRVNQNVFLIVFIGVLFFVLSDSIIAVNKFKAGQVEIPFARIWIMSLYILGQYLIVRGSEKMERHESTTTLS